MLGKNLRGKLYLRNLLKQKASWYRHYVFFTKAKSNYCKKYIVCSDAVMTPFIEISANDSSLCLKSVQIWSFSWSVFSCIWTEYGDLRSKSPYSVRIQEIRTRKDSLFGHFSRSDVIIQFAAVCGRTLDHDTIIKVYFHVSFFHISWNFLNNGTCNFLKCII